MALMQNTRRSYSSTVSISLSPVSRSHSLRDNSPLYHHSSDWLLLVGYSLSSELSLVC